MQQLIQVAVSLLALARTGVPESPAEHEWPADSEDGCTNPAADQDAMSAIIHALVSVRGSLKGKAADMSMIEPKPAVLSSTHLVSVQQTVHGACWLHTLQ